MLDRFTDGLRWLALLALALPIVYALGHALIHWGLKPLWRNEPPKKSEPKTAKVEDLGIVQDGHVLRLPLKNVGSAPARDVHVYLNNRPITDARGGVSAEQHPIPNLKPGDQHTYRIATGAAAERERARIRIEWTDDSGKHVEESVVMTP